MPNRLRFAPSPTGFLHVGGARTALFNWLFVKKYGGQFLLRVEDTDKARGTDESTRAIFEGLEWLGLEWDEDVVFQGANLERHRTDVARLLDADKAYRCFCTTAELDEQRKAAEANHVAFRYDRRCANLAPDEVTRRVAAGTPFVVRFRMPEGQTSWDDLVHGTITFANKDIGEGDFIVLRSDATPIYNLAVVSDDIAMGITLVMRGDDHISNTPKQILLYDALGVSVPQFAHLPPHAVALMREPRHPRQAAFVHIGIEQADHLQPLAGPDQLLRDFEGDQSAERVADERVRSARLHRAHLLHVRFRHFLNTSLRRRFAIEPERLQSVHRTAVLQRTDERPAFHDGTGHAVHEEKRPAVAVTHPHQNLRGLRRAVVNRCGELRDGRCEKQCRER